MNRIARAPLALLAPFLLAGALSAQVLRVDAAAPPGGNGSSWQAAYRDLRFALLAAETNPTVTEVWVKAGRYRPHASDPAVAFEIPADIGVYGGFAGGETARDQRDPAAHVTILDGDLLGDDGPAFANRADNSVHVVLASHAGSIVLDGFTVRGGNIGEGAVKAAVASATLANLRLVENKGALGFDASSVLVSRCVFADNDATSGAGVNMGFTTGVPTQARVEDCTFERNTGGDGAGVRMQRTGSLSIVRCAFRNGRTTSGAAVSGGGGVHGPLHVVVRDCEVARNASCAGAFFFHNDTSVRVERCLFVSNASRTGCGSGSGGGGIRSNGVDLEISGSRFYDNGTGAVWLEGSAIVSIDSSTFYSLSSAAAIRANGGTVELFDTIVWGASAIAQVRLQSGAVLLADHSDVRLGGLTGAGNLDADPLFVDPGAGDLRLAAGSPCIDAGAPIPSSSDAADFELDSRLLDGDLDGTVRVDMGADELAPIHLEVQGTPVAGGTLTLVTTGTSGLRGWLYVGLPGQVFRPRAGTLFVRVAGAVRTSWPATPSSVPVSVPPTVAGLLLHVQELAVAGGGAAVTLSNYVPLQF